jgi:Aldo/keto reductase family
MRCTILHSVNPSFHLFRSRPFVTSTIIGATNVDQLEQNIKALNMPISDEVAEMINEVYSSFRDPTKGLFEIIDPTVEYIDPTKLPWGAKDQDVDPELDILINQRLSKF